MARAPRNRSRQKGIAVDIDGLDELIANLRRGRRDLPDVFRAVLRGPGGRLIKSKLQDRTPKRTGATARSIEIHDQGRDGVEIGPGDGDHPKSGRPFKLLGRLLESGAKAHTIRARRGGLAGVVGFRKEVPHPGFRGRRVMARTLRLKSVERPVTQEVVNELERRRWAQGGTA